MTEYLLICSCGHRMKVTETYMGKVGTCVKCKQKILISEKNTRPIGKGAARVASSRRDEVASEKKRRIGELLIDANLISVDQLKEALQVQMKTGAKTGEILLSLGYFDVKTFAAFLAKQPGIASIDLSNYQVPKELLSLIPADFARKHDIFPIDRLGSLLTVAMACPLDSRTIKELEERTNLRVKALLCPMDDIRAVIARYYPEEAAATPAMTDDEWVKHIEGTLKLENVAALVRRLGSLPALPDTVYRMRAAMQDQNVSMPDVVKIVQTDPAITAKILSVANSAAYGFPHRVDSVNLAATLLGLNEICGLAMSLAVIDTIKGSYREFWTGATACAEMAVTIAKASTKKTKTGVYAAALLHDIGRIALLEVDPQRYAKIQSNIEGAELIAREQEALGLAHTEAGYELASKWGLPIEIAEPIRFHHAFHYAEQAKETTAVVAVASTVTECHDNGQLDEKVVMDNCGEAMAFLGLDFGTVVSLAASPNVKAAASPDPS